MALSKGLRKFRATQLLINRGLLPKPIERQKYRKDAKAVSPKRSGLSPTRTSKKKSLSAADDEPSSSSKTFVTSTTRKRSSMNVRQKGQSSVKKRKLENIFDIDSDISEALSEIDDPLEEEQVDENEEMYFVPFFEKKNQSSPNLVDLDLDLSNKIDSFEYINFNKLENDDSNSETIYGSESDIFEALFSKNNDNDTAATEEEDLVLAECRDELMNYSLHSVEDQDDEIMICSKSMMNNLLKSSKLICYNCDESKLEFQINDPKNKKTFVQTISIYCKRCRKNLCNTRTSEKIDFPEHGRGQRKWTYKNAIRYALGSLSSGTTYQKGAEFLKHMSITPLSKNSYLRLMKQATSIICKKLEEMKDEAANIVKEYYSKKGVELDNGAMNIAVTFDGLWIRHGTNCKYGVAFVVESETGLILDAYLASSFCLSCRRAKRRFKNDLAGLKDWKRSHKANCDINYAPSKSMELMEAEAAKILFGQSLQRGLRYITIVSDDDSPTYKTLCESNPYNGYHIKRIDCLTHVAKKIFRKLEEGIKQEKLGKKGVGKITQNISGHFSNFYRFAVIKYFGNYNKIRELMHASIDHHISTDEKPLHAKCSLKWCKYLMAQKKEISIPSNWHKYVRNIKYSLSEEDGNFMREIFNEMTTEEVLNKVSGKSQNLNESIHLKLWNLFPKEGSRSAKQVQFCIAQICLEHNYGKKGASIADQFFIAPGKPLMDSFAR